MNERPNNDAGNDAGNEAAASAPNDATASPAPKRRRFWLFAGLAGAATTLAACAQPGSGARGEGGGGWGGWGARHGHGHHGWGRRGPIDPQKMAERVDRGVDRVLSQVDASDEQKRKVATIAKQTLTELAPMREKFRDARRRGVELLAAATIDRAAIERLRAEQLQAADTLSRRISVAMVDVAEVLDAGQRAKLKAGLERRMGRRWS
ncbi:MAG: periplasmic heavy metal sensor [Burkholderiaceae bacterium]|nr:periplasmic heavy metal sensor [Burkholderiaceae bacterium]